MVAAAILSTLVAINVVGLTIAFHLRQKMIRRARRKWLYPQKGHEPRMDHVHRLVIAGDLGLAAKVYRQVNKVGMREARQAVERIATIPGQNGG